MIVLRALLAIVIWVVFFNALVYGIAFLVERRRRYRKGGF
jgi:hypothetical protein